MQLLQKARKGLKEGGPALVLRRALLKIWYATRRHSMMGELANPPWMGAALEIREATFEATAEDVRIAARLLKAYKSAFLSWNTHTGNLWDHIQQTQYADLLPILEAGDAQQLAAYMVNMHDKGLAYGISDLNTTYFNKYPKRVRMEGGLLIWDRFQSLATALGVWPSEVEKALGIDITPPDIDGGLLKVKVGNGWYSERDIYSIYTAHRLYKIMSTEGEIAEIGPGLGKVALYASRMGFKRYDLYDLPITNIAQGWYLLKAGLSAQLYGEDKEEGIRVLPYWMFDGKTKYETVLNQDSFPELGEPLVIDYLKKIKKCAQNFLSINGETGGAYNLAPEKRLVVVPDLVDRVTGFERVSREPFRIGKGYIEELYAVKRG